MKNVLFFGLLCLCLATSACKYDKPGSSGEIPETGYDETFLIGVMNPVADELQCNKRYTIKATSREGAITCEDYNFTELYQNTYKRLTDRLKDIRCPDDCDKKNIRLLSQRGECRDQYAFVQIVISILCRSDDNDFPGLSQPNPQTLQHPFNDSLDMPMPVDDETLYTQSTPNLEADDCPYTFQYKFTQSTMVANCEDVHDYRPYIKYIKQRAAFVLTNTRCGENCRKTQTHELGLSWKCENGTVIIDYAVQLECKE